MTTPRNKAKNPTLAQWLIELAGRHAAVCAVAAGILVFGVFALTLWFTLFSGINASADFVYAKF